MKTKQVIITPENLRLQKVSDIFESCIEDIKLCQKNKIGIDMDKWVDNDLFDEVCTVCLGGAALVGFCVPPPTYFAIKDALTKARYTENRVTKIERLMDTLNYFRSQDYNSSAYNFVELTGRKNEKESIQKAMEDAETSFYSGELSSLQIQRLIKDIERVVINLRKVNL